MISVGIYENLVIYKVTKNDQKTLVIGVKESGKIDPLAALNMTGGTKLEGESKDFLIYPPKPENFEGQPDTFENNLKKIGDIKDQLEHIVKQYITTNNIKWDVFAGTGVTSENMTTKMTSATVLTQVYENIVDQFIKMITPHVSDNGKKVRMIFVRSSAAKHYPALRKRYLETYPFIESMEVPKAQSKLKFSKYEIDKGFNSGEPVAGAAETSTQDAESASTLFAN
jgi:hypothetical protein